MQTCLAQCDRRFLRHLRKGQIWLVSMLVDYILFLQMPVRRLVRICNGVNVRFENKYKEAHCRYRTPAQLRTRAARLSFPLSVIRRCSSKRPICQPTIALRFAHLYFSVQNSLSSFQLLSFCRLIQITFATTFLTQRVFYHRVFARTP